MSSKNLNWINSNIFLEALKEALFRFKPQDQFYSPVMFITYLGALATTIYTLISWDSPQFNFNLHISFWLWFTIFLANLASTVAEGRGKAQAQSLKKSQTTLLAKKIIAGKEVQIPATDLRCGDVVNCVAGDMIPCDGEVIEGIATVDESAITGESAPVIRESGGDRSAVTAGTKVVSDGIKIKSVSEPGNSFLDRMIHLIEGAERQKTPNEIALNIVLSSLTIIFLLSTVSFRTFIHYMESDPEAHSLNYVTIPVLVSLLVCLIPTTIGALLNAIGIAGMDRLVQKNVIATSGRSVEAAGDIDLLVVDKTGTITLGNRMATDFIPATPYTKEKVATIAQLASLADETPEGRSIVILAKELFSIRGEDVKGQNIEIIPFSAKSKMSGINFFDSQKQSTRTIRKGSVEAIRKYTEGLGGKFPEMLLDVIEKISRSGGTPLLVSDGNKIVGLIHLKDVVKGGIKQRFGMMRNMGIRTLMVTGDNPLTAAAIAAEAGVDDFIAEATPEIKLARIREEQKKGHLIAMTGDGTNDAPALAQADVGVAMNTGTQASREAGNMVDLDSNPTKLLDIVEIGKQLLMTRGALTTFSIANDVAKYFAILPAILMHFYAEDDKPGPLSILNIMHLSSQQSAILSAVIFNALIIGFLIPLALRGVAYKPQSANQLLKRNLLYYGLGGLIAPFIGIKLIDMAINALGWIS
jgi:K+-transporting ATPase ATPase B chain